MAKAKKRKSTRASFHHNAEHHHHFLLIVGGGFLLMLLILLTYNNLPFVSNYQQQAAVPQESMENESSDEVSIENYAFTPNTITVKAGTTVMFTNNDTVSHTATADDGSFDTGTIQGGQTGEVTFDTPGTYLYHCSLHPNMTGTIVVEE